MLYIKTLMIYWNRSFFHWILTLNYIIFNRIPALGYPSTKSQARTTIKKAKLKQIMGTNLKKTISCSFFLFFIHDKTFGIKVIRIKRFPWLTEYKDILQRRGITVEKLHNPESKVNIHKPNIGRNNMNMVHIVTF